MDRRVVSVACVVGLFVVGGCSVEEGDEVASSQSAGLVTCSDRTDVAYRAPNDAYLTYKARARVCVVAPVSCAGTSTLGQATSLLAPDFQQGFFGAPASRAGKSAGRIEDLCVSPASSNYTHLPVCPPNTFVVESKGVDQCATVTDVVPPGR